MSLFLVNRHQNGLIPNFLQNIFLFRRRTAHRLWTPWAWVNNDRRLIFDWTVPLMDNSSTTWTRCHWVQLEAQKCCGTVVTDGPRAGGVLTVLSLGGICCFLFTLVAKEGIVLSFKQHTTWTWGIWHFYTSIESVQVICVWTEGISQLVINIIDQYSGM